MIAVTDQPPPDTPADPPPARPPSRSARSVETVVVEERGRWAVDIVVVFDDGVVRRRIDTYHTRARAELSARLIKRGAERDIRGPLNG